MSADIPAVIDSLHPLEIKVLSVLMGKAAMGPGVPLGLPEDQLAQATGLEPSQVSMAVEWLLAKALLRVDSEKVTRMVSLTPLGERYFEKYSPIERILSAVRDAGQVGRRLTIQEIQAKEELEATEMSGAIGRLKKEGTIRIGAGATVEATGAPSRSAEALRGALRRLHAGPEPLTAFPDAVQPVIEDHAVKRGNPKEPFRIDDRVERCYALTPAGEEA
jgi:phenylalanyl-tRNA synthetase alpha chain